MNLLKLTERIPAKTLSRKKLLAATLVLMLVAKISLGTRTLAEDGPIRTEAPATSATQLAQAEIATEGLGKQCIDILSHAKAEATRRFDIETQAGHQESSTLLAPFTETTIHSAVSDTRWDVPMTISPTGLPRFGSYTARAEEPRYDVLRGTFAQVGGGLEYRLASHTRTFIDASRVLRDEEKYTDVIRVGLRYAF